MKPTVTKSANAASKRAHALAEVYVKPSAYDAEDERLRAVAGLDLTDEEQADLAEVLRLRIAG